MPPDWIKSCDQSEEERRAKALAAWRARVVPQRLEAAHEVPGHLRGQSIAMQNWSPPDTPRSGCKHSRQRADGRLDYRYVPKGERTTRRLSRVVFTTTNPGSPPDPCLVPSELPATMGVSANWRQKDRRWQTPQQNRH